MISLLRTVWVLLFIFSSSSLSFAAVSLSLNPVDGSNTLRFREADGFNDRKEIRIRVNSTGEQRYQVFQRLVEPMVNEKGEAMDLRALQTSAIGNSNGSGTLYLQNIDHLGMGEQLIYTSGQTGVTDSFVVAYGIDPAVFNGSGNYSGRLSFMVRAMGESSQDESFVSLFVESRSSNLKTVVSGGHSKDRVRVKDSDVDPARADFVTIALRGRSGGNVRVSQEVAVPPRNQAGDEIGLDVLQFSVGGSSADGVRLQDAVPLSRSGALLYSGRGQENDIEVRFVVDPAKAALQNAGVYTGKLQYVVETDSGREDFAIDLDVEIQPVFTVDVTLPPEGVSFLNVQANAPAVDREVEVSVRSNLHRPYQVLQDLQAAMTNERGEEIKKEYFMVKVELPAEVKGHTKFTELVPMQTGEYPVFSSDSQGSPAQFKVIYRLQGYPQMSGGNYAAPIRFSLNQN